MVRRWPLGRWRPNDSLSAGPRADLRIGLPRRRHARTYDQLMRRAVILTMAIGGTAFGAMVAVIAAASSVLYMVPAEACDSSCWRNDAATRVLGVIGIPLAVATIAVIPFATWIGQRRPRSAIVIVASVAVAMTAWWVTGNHLLDAATLA